MLLQPHLAMSIEELFTTIEEALHRGADSISVRYHPALGYPMSIFIDYYKQAADDEFIVSVKDVRAVH
jgi:hypothetical protein